MHSKGAQQAVVRATLTAWEEYSIAVRTARLAVKRGSKTSGLRRVGWLPKGVPLRCRACLVGLYCARAWAKQPKAVQRAKARRREAAHALLPLMIKGPPEPEAFGLLTAAEIAALANHRRPRAERLSLREIRRRLRNLPSVGGAGRVARLWHQGIILHLRPDLRWVPKPFATPRPLTDLADTLAGEVNPFAENPVKRRARKSLRL